MNTIHFYIYQAGPKNSGRKIERDVRSRDVKSRVHLYWKLHENSWNFWRKSNGICRQMQDHQDLEMISIVQVKVINLIANFARFDQKRRKFWKISRKLWYFLIKISMENWLFFHYLLLNISWSSASSLKVYTSGRYHQISTAIFPIYGGRSDVPLYSRRHWPYFHFIFNVDSLFM